MKRISLIAVLALFPHLALADSPAQVTTLLTTKFHPEGCDTPIPAWNFGPNDKAAYIFFVINNIVPGMQVRARVFQDVDGDFDQDSSQYYAKAVWPLEEEAGNFCYVTSLPIKDQTFADLAGEWSVRLEYDSGSGFVPFDGATSWFNLAPNASSSDLVLSVSDVDTGSRPQIKMTALVRDAAGNALSALKPGNFVLTDNGARRELSLRPVDDRDRFSVALILDSSAQARNNADAYADEKQAAKQFLGEFRPADEVAVYAMGGKVALMQDFTTDRTAATAAIDTLAEGDAAPLYQAIVTASNDLARRSGRRTIVLWAGSSNQAENSPAFDEVISAAHAAGARVVGVGFGNAKHHILDLAALDTGGFYSTPHAGIALSDLADGIVKNLSAGNELSFTADDAAAEHTFQLVAQVDGKESEPVSTQVGGAPSGPAAPPSPVGIMAFTAAAVSQFVTLDTASGKVTGLNVNGYDAALSPDGRKFAYRDFDDLLHVISLDSGADVLMSAGTDSEYGPTFVGNDTVAYLCEKKQGMSICLSPADRFSERVWTGKVPVELAYWMTIEWIPSSGTQSPAFVLANAKPGIYLLTGMDAKLIVPASGSASYRYPSVSPDGQRLAYTLYDGDHDIYVVDLAGGTPKRLTNTRDSMFPCWSPDGKSIAFLSTSIVARGSWDTGRINSYLYAIWIMDTSGQVTGVVEGSDGKWVNVKGDRIAWR